MLLGQWDQQGDQLDLILILELIGFKLDWIQCLFWKINKKTSKYQQGSILIHPFDLKFLNILML